MNVWALTETDLATYKLNEDLIEICLSGVGGYKNSDIDVNIQFDYCIAGALPVVHLK